MPDLDEMEIGLRKPSRLCLNLGKYQVIERSNSFIKVALGGSVTMTFAIPERADVKAGDLLTFYTEVLYANPKPPPIE